MPKTKLSLAQAKQAVLGWPGNGEGELVSKDTHSPKGGKWGVLQGERQVHHQKLGQRTKISSNSWCMGSPSRPLALAQMALVCCAQLLLCPTLCDHMDRNTPGSSVRGIS